MPDKASVSSGLAGSGGRLLYLNVVLKVDNPMSIGHHLLVSDVEQHTSVVPSMLGVTKVTVNLL
jgi:hypothetical protein